MGNLNNLYISQSFQSLAHLGTDNALVPGTMTLLQDGIGQSLNISFDGTNISSSGNIYAANLTGSGGSINTGSLMVTGSVAVNVLTFTKGDGSQFSLTVASSGSVTPGTISGSAQITALGFVSSSVTASSLITASFSGNTLTFTKGDSSTFGVVIPDVSGSTINTGSFVTTSSFNTYTSSNNQRVSSLETNSASVNTSITNLNTFSASALVSINNLNSTTASLNTSVSNINTATASLFTSASLSLITASVNLNTITFTKGDGTTFPITVNTGSGAGTIDTGSLLVTASVNNDDITFTKGDGSQFTIQVATGSFAISASYAETASLAINAKDIVVDVKNTTGTQIDKGTVVRIIGATGDNALIGTASWTDDDNSANTLGFVVDNIANDAFGRVMTQGTLLGIDTDPVLGYTAGQLIYLSSSGQYTNVKPPAPYHEVRLGQVLRAQQNNGSVYVLIQNGYELTELHDVDINTGSLANNDLLAWNSASQQWVNKTVTGVGATTSASFNSYTSSNDQKVNSLIAATGSYATTGSNTFTGDQTLIDNAGNFFTISDSSGSMMLVAKGFTSASAHISASSAGIGNFIFKTNSNTADTIISGSSNIFTNPGTPSTGFKRYLGGTGNISLTGTLPQISGSMQFSPVISNNNLGAQLTMRGPVSSSQWAIATNNIQGGVNIGNTALNHAQGIVAGLTMTGNNINGNLAIIANRTNTTQNTSITFNQLVTGTTTLNMNSSSILLTGNLIGGVTTITNNTTGSNRVSPSGNAAYVAQNIMMGGTTITASGSNDPNDTTDTDTNANIVRSLIVGNSNAVQLQGGFTGSNSLSATSILGNNLIVTGSSPNSIFNTALPGTYGSAFVGRFNAVDGNRALSAQTIFAVGTGTSTSNRKTGFLIDSGSNSFFEGTVNISGSLLVNGVAPVTGDTGSFATTGSNSFNGNQIITGSLIVSSSAGQFNRFNALDVTQQRIATSLAFTSSRFAGGIISTSIEMENLSSYQFGFNQLASSDGNTGTQFILETNKDSLYTELKLNARYTGSSNAELKLRNSNGVRSLTVDVDNTSINGNIKLNKGSNKPSDIVTVGSSSSLTVSNSLVTVNSIILVTTQDRESAPSTSAAVAVVGNKGTGTFDIFTNYAGNLQVAYLIINPT